MSIQEESINERANFLLSEAFVRVKEGVPLGPYKGVDAAAEAMIKATLYLYGGKVTGSIQELEGLLETLQQFQGQKSCFWDMLIGKYTDQAIKNIEKAQEINHQSL